MRAEEDHRSMRSWRKELGATETIYEEEDKSCSSSLLSSSHCSSLLSSLHTRVDEWSRARGSKPDVVVRVHDHRFYLHKVPLLAHSGYFRRHVDAESTVVIVSPPSTITAETFAFVAGFCYGSEISMTPFNVAAVRIAAEWLEMTNDEWDECGVVVEGEGEGEGEGNLMERAEWYFCQVLASSAEYATEVLRSCISLLPDATESAAFLAGRCVEAITASDGVDKTKSHWLDDLVKVKTEEFQMIADSIHDRLSDCHDLLYRIVDHYLENFPGNASPSEEEKNRICSVVDCRKLSRPHLVHLVRNRRMPLRFVVQAMLIEQLHTRVSFFDRVRKNRGDEDVITASSTAKTGGSMTLGDMLQRDAASRQKMNLKASMEETCFRIRSLETDLSCMRRILREFKLEEDAEAAMRSESCRFWAEEEKHNRKEVEKIDRGSGKLYLKVIRGFKSVLFRRSGSDNRSSGCSGHGDIRPTHPRNRSLT